MHIFTSRPRFLAARIAALAVVLMVAPSCKKEMSLEEARKTAVSMSSAPLVVSVDTGNGVSALEDEAAIIEPDEARRLRALADTQPKPGLKPAELSRFLSERSDAAWALGRYVQARDDAMSALNIARKAGAIPPKAEARLLSKAARAITVHGEFRKAEAMYAESLALAPHPIAYLALAGARLKKGDFSGAESATQDGLQLIAQWKSKKGGKKSESGNKARKIGKLPVFEHRLKSQIYMARGEYGKAEEEIRELIDLYGRQGKGGMRPLVKMRGTLAKALARQDRLSDAEYEAGRALAEAAALSGKDSALTADLLAVMVDVLMRRGRFDEAEKSARLRMDIYLNAGMEPDSGKLADAEFTLGKVLAAQGRYVEALDRFEAVRSRMSPKSGRADKFGMRSPDCILALAAAGNAKHSLALAEAALKADGKRDFGRHTAELNGLKGYALIKTGRTGPALTLLAETVPNLEEQYADTSNRAKKERLRTVIEAYSALLNTVQGTPLEKDFIRKTGATPAETAFRLADRLASITVRSALSAGGVRAAAAFDPELAELIREEQDSGLRAAALEDTLASILASTDGADSEEVDELKDNIALLTEARLVLRTEVESRFPKYSEALDPEPPSPDRVRSLLKPGESLLVIHPGRENTLVWCVPANGPMRFESVPLNEREMAVQVDRLRSALACNPAYLGDIPAFDTRTAHALYTTLLAPVREGFESADTLIIAAGGPAASLPFSVLTTREANARPDKEVLFREYRDVPWLARDHAVTRIPSVSALIALRSTPPAAAGRSPMIGFGDPFFSPDRRQEPETAGRTATRSALRVRNAGKIVARGDSAEPAGIELLAPLPDTRTELVRIARTLDADPNVSLFMGQAAAEERIKSLDLSGSRVLVFATHALRPGDLRGLDQPALALAAPSVTGGTEDGLLTMAEIMPLHLNADWVVLSACDTGGGADNKGSEALSGLGQAFFYAGSRALLVTLWPVETGSAAMLTTSLFRFLAENPGLSRAEALNRSMLHLMDGPGITDPDTGETIADFAHPFFWAPFILAGEGGE